MKVVLINPNIHGEFRINMGLLYLISYLEKETKFSYSLLDLTFHRKKWKKYLKKQITRLNPDVIGFSCMTFNFYDSLLILKYIRSFYLKGFVIFGGTHPTIQAEESIKFKNVNAICIGEGEYNFKEVLLRLEQNKDLSDIPGIWFKKDHKIIKNQKSKFVEDLDSLPFLNWSHYDLEKYLIVNPYELKLLGSRGCPFNCTYCLNHVLRNAQTGTYVRFRSPENIIAEIKYQLKELKHLNLKYFYFWDDMFNLKKDFIVKFCNLFIEEKLNQNYSWGISSRIDTIDEERLKYFKKANLNLFRIGIEAGNERIRRDVYLKNISNAEIVKKRNLLKSYGFNMQADFIIGGPKETLKEIHDTYNMIKYLKPEQISINVFQPYPQLNATKILIQEGAEIDPDKWQNIKTFFFKTVWRKESLPSWRFKLNVIKINLYVIITIFLKHLKKKKLRFIADILKFFLYYYPKYHFLLHDLYKFTIRKYIYEKNLNF